MSYRFAQNSLTGQQQGSSFKNSGKKQSWYNK